MSGKRLNDGEEPPAVIFLHIPKTAGATLHRIIERQYEPSVIFTLDGSRVQESLDQFKKLPQTKRAEVKILKGHASFGIHEFLPQSSTYITLLRDPVDRVISFYYYILQEPHHYLHDELIARRMSLKDLVSSEISSKEIFNIQTRLLSEPLPGEGLSSVQILERAKRNLREKFSVVGLSERFDETLILLKRAFGWRIPFYRKENVTRNRPRKSEIPKDTLRLIEKQNELDTELYQYVKKLFEEEVSQQTFFEKELRRFRRLNNSCGKIYLWARSVVGKIKRGVTKGLRLEELL